MRSISILLLVLFTAPPVFPSDRDVKILTEGVSLIGQAGVPGPVCAFGERTFPVILGKSGGVRYPLVVAGRYGRGRVVAFGHGGYLSPNSNNVGPLLANSVKWCTQDRRKIVIGVLRNPGLAGFFREKGWQVTESPLSNLDSLHVLVADNHYLGNDPEIANISRFIKKGGGFVTAGLGWGWSQLNPRKNLVLDHPGNRLLADAGIVWADGYLSKTTQNGFRVGSIPDPLTQANRALKAFSSGKKMGDADRAQAMETLSLAIRSIPPDDSLLIAPLKAILRSKGGKRTLPSKKNGIGLNRPLERLLLTWEIIQMRRLPANKIKPHPAAALFPGSVPKGAKRVTKLTSVDTSIPGWHSTGLYAIPGKTITVRIPAELIEKKLAVRIGAHKDRLWGKESWWRAPEITNRVVLDEEMTVSSNAFGGLVYIDVPRNCRSGAVEITVEGAVNSPLYIHGVTSLKEWKKSIRNFPGPWAEIGTKKMIVTVPSHVVRKLDSPDKVAECWTRIMDLDEKLAGVSCAKDRPARIVPDIQISAGYMHSGYPIMTHLDQISNLVDSDHLKRGNWGFFHEIGHNHQNGDWTFQGTGEVTVNLFSLYVFEYFCDKPPSIHERGSRDFRLKKMSAMNFDKPDFGKWKSDPFLALVMYIQIQQEFGWDPFQKVFREYLSLSKKVRPQNDADKRDQWMVRMSRQVGHNLGPFFQLWGVPTSDKARKSISQLPVWISKDFPARYHPKKENPKQP